MTEEDIEAEWWAYHYQENKATVEFDDDDENAATDYLAQIKAEAEAAEAAGLETAAATPVEQQEPQADPVPDDWGEPE